MTRFSFLFAFIAIVSTSCSLSRNVGSASSASFKKLQIAQQATVDNHGKTGVPTPIVIAVPQKANKNTLAKAPDAKSAKKKIVHTAYKLTPQISTATAKAPGIKIVASAKEPFKPSNSKIRNAEIGMKQALVLFIGGLVVGFIFDIIAVTTINGFSVGTILSWVFGILAGVCLVIALVGLTFIIIDLVNR